MIDHGGAEASILTQRAVQIQTFMHLGLSGITESRCKDCSSAED